MPVPLLYIDPGAGSILLQALIAGVIGAGWRLAVLFRRRSGSRPAGTVSAPLENTDREPAKPTPDKTAGDSR